VFLLYAQWDLKLFGWKELASRSKKSPLPSSCSAGILLGCSSQEWSAGLRVKIRKKLFLVVVFQGCGEYRSSLTAPTRSHGDAVVLGKEISCCPTPSAVVDSRFVLIGEPIVAAPAPSDLLVSLGVDEARSEVEFLVNFA